MRAKSEAIDKNDHEVISRCGYAFRPGGSNESTAIPHFFSANGEGLWLEASFLDAAAFLIAGGPSFAQVDKGRLDRAWTMTLNNATASYRGNANCTVDDPSRFSLSTWLDPRIQKFVPMSSMGKPLWDNRLVEGVQRWEPTGIVVAECPNVVGYWRNERFEPSRFLYEETINWGCHAKYGGGRSVMLPALRILHLLGFRRVFLLGVDFEMSETSKYHFAEDRLQGAIRGNMASYGRLRTWFEALQPYFLKENFIVKNCNQESKLGVFPFVPYEEALAEAAESLGDYERERTTGMYKPLKDKLAEAGVKPAAKGRTVLRRAQTEREPLVIAEMSGRRQLILRNFQSPGDIVMLTAAVRDLHKSNPGRFRTDVRTSCGQLWENNPYVEPIDEREAGLKIIECEYPLIHASNTGPWHFIHGFTQHLAASLGVEITPTLFKGDIHLSAAEKSWISQVQETTKTTLPFWIVVAGGKRDYTIKWWERERFQAVVDYFRGRILFVQVGEAGHEHPALRDVLDLRGRTDLRQLVRLVHHAQGVLCPVTLLMHLAAAVETRAGMPKNRPCVVIAGGREPSQWEAYPHHQFIHSNGALMCCDDGGCWKSRTTPLGDGDEKDRPENLCVDVVPGSSANGAKQAGGGVRNAFAHPPEQWPGLLPRCMDTITSEDVIRRIELYFDGGAINYLSEHEAAVCAQTIPALEWKTR